MKEEIIDCLNNMKSKDRIIRYDAFLKLMDITLNDVYQASDVWDDIILLLEDKSAHIRSATAQALFNLAKSENTNRIFKDFPRIKTVLEDKSFVTSRHSLNALSKVALISDKHLKLVIDYYIERFVSCINEKNRNLIRFDIIKSIKNIYSSNMNDLTRETVNILINLEEDITLQKKYRKIFEKK